MKKQTDIKIELVVVGSGDLSVGIHCSQEYVTVTFHDQWAEHFDKESMVDGLKEFLASAMENCRTKVYTKVEFEKISADEEFL